MKRQPMPEMIRARVSPGHKRALEAAAIRRGQSLSEFIRGVTLKAAGII